MKAALFGLVISGLGCLAILQRISSADIEDIQKRGTLKAWTVYGANSYFLYRGQPMGFEYDLLTLLAKEIGVELELKVTPEADNIINMLNSGEGDIIAGNLVVTKSRARNFQFTDLVISTRQVLVQRRGAKLIRNPLQLIGKTVHVRRGSHYYDRLVHLSEEIGGDIDIRTVRGDTITEELIKQVANKEIDFTIADENTALINQSYYPQLDVSTAVSFPQRIAWMVRPAARELLERVNEWLRRIKKDRTLAVVYDRYYRVKRVFSERIKSEYHSLTGGKISRYDKLLRKGAARIGWDWRLLSSLAFQESRFNARARSWAGARGLLQVMPRSGPGYSLYNPAQNVEAGTKYLGYMMDKWKPIISSDDERLKFILASYNAGPGHVEDARRLAARFGKNPDVWYDNVEFFIRNLSNPKYYNDPVVKHGYCRGEEPYLYVREILGRYKHYQKFIKL